MNIYFSRINETITYKRTIENTPFADDVEGVSILPVFYEWIQWNDKWYELPEGDLIKLTRIDSDDLEDYVSKLKPFE
jgi:hypothetical protein